VTQAHLCQHTLALLALKSTLTACADTALLSETGTTAGTAATDSSGTAAAAAAGADAYNYADDDVDGCCADYASQSSDAVATVAAAPPQLQGILALLVAKVVAVGHALAAASKASHSSANATAGSATVHRDSTEQGSALRVCKRYS
jgi:prophage DNA circulation protein